MKHINGLFAIILAIIWITPVQAQQEFIKDLALQDGSIRTQANVIVGRQVRIYATVKNFSDQDLFGTVKFYDENNALFIDDDQPVSIIAGGTDDVFVDWNAEKVGDFPITARVIPWDEEGDNPDNNKITTSIFVDYDSDKDGIANYEDDDDDNDGVADNSDAFPLNAGESRDSDGDGIGNNADEDDDGDGVSDLEDAFPTDSSETVDSDGDGVGDNSDAFPNDAGETKDSDEDGVGDNSDIDNANKGPVPNIDTKDMVVSTGDTITFNALKALDPDGEIVSYEWDFGDGVESTSVIAEKIFEKAGTYEIKLKVTDDKGESRTGMISVTVIQKWQTFSLIFIGILLILLVIYSARKAPNGLWNTGKDLPKKKKPLPGKKK